MANKYGKERRCGEPQLGVKLPERKFGIQQPLPFAECMGQGFTATCCRVLIILRILLFQFGFNRECSDIKLAEVDPSRNCNIYIEITGSV